MDNTMDVIHILFDRVFRCRVPVIATYTDDELNNLGMPILKVDDVKKKTDYDELVTVYLTVNTLVEIFSEGHPIHIYNDDDISLIYKAIDEHLSNWRYRVANTLHIPDAPESDLAKLDAFATEIFNNNKALVAGTIAGKSNDMFSIDLNLMGDLKHSGVVDVTDVKRESNIEPSKNKGYSLDDLLM
jgi:hypothetical protein